MDNRRPGNLFLQALTPLSYQALNEHLAPTDFALSACLQHDEAPVDWVYFPESGLLSLISAVETGESLETAMVGFDGAAGLVEACGSQISHTSCVVQMSGRGWRAPAGAVRSLLLSDASFGVEVRRIGEFQLLEARQAAICQALHTVEQRLARRLLEGLDRSIGNGPLPLTQESLATLLSVQRTTVTAYAILLQQSGVISYRRGQVEVLDRPALEAKACACRTVVQKYRNTLGLAMTLRLRAAGV